MKEKKSLYRDMFYADSDREKTIIVRKDEWKIKPPITYREKMRVKNRRAIIMGNVNIDSLTHIEFNEYDKLAYVAEGVQEGPPWFKDHYESNFMDIPDDGLIDELYEHISTFQIELEKKIRSGEFGQKGKV